MLRVADGQNISQKEMKIIMWQFFFYLQDAIQVFFK